ncbi:MAG TPA: hypothetical protein GX391_10245 [Firmicutes bacterium]|jgi:hypothetical protein|nr:hypothetical protein [Bacillota bacterium]HPT66659.1 hypothetical protein [Bacillota bacterium]
MDQETRAQLNSIALECQEYQPIAVAENLAYSYGEEVEDAGCDSCLHWENRGCNIYRKELKED